MCCWLFVYFSLVCCLGYCYVECFIVLDDVLFVILIGIVVVGSCDGLNYVC